MKNLFAMPLPRGGAVWFVGLIGLLHAAPARAEPEKPQHAEPRVELMTSLVTPLVGSYYLEINTRIASPLSVLVNTSRLTLASHDSTLTANTVGAGLSYYFQGHALRYWYVEAIGELLLGSWRHEPSGKSSSTGFGGTGMVLAGYRFVHDLGPVLDLGAGFVGLRTPGALVKTSAGDVSIEAATRFYPAVKVSVGWAF